LIHGDGSGTRLVPTGLDFDGLLERLFRTRPDVRGHREAFAQARTEQDRFATAFHLDRLFAYAPESPELFVVHSRRAGDPILTARTAVHSPTIVQANEGPLALRAASGDALALRLVGGLLIRNGEPDKAVGPLVIALALRTPDRPPVEELLFALAHAKAGRLDDATKWHAKAVAWLDKYQRPMQVASAVGTASTAGWGGALELLRAQADPRDNPFDWETWFECRVFRAEVEGLLAGKK
jgi:hypothetical protein